MAGYFGINPPGSVAAVVALAFGLAAASFFPAIVLGIFDRRMNKQGAVAGMVCGISLMLFYTVRYKLGWFDGGFGPTAPADWWLGVSPEGSGTIAMLFNAGVALAVSRLTPAPPSDIQELVESIRYPAGVGRVAATH